MNSPPPTRGCRNSGSQNTPGSVSPSMPPDNTYGWTAPTIEWPESPKESSDGQTPSEFSVARPVCGGHGHFEKSQEGDGRTKTVQVTCRACYGKGTQP